MKKIRPISLLLIIAFIMYVIFIMKDENVEPPIREIQDEVREDTQVKKGSLDGFTIVLDPGHGGAVGVNDTIEKNITYLTARNIEKELDRHGATVILTRKDDSFVELEDRVQTAMSKQADLFISRDHRVAHGDYFVLRENQVPAVLLELGYITNPEDEECMNTDHFQQHIAEAVANGVVKYQSAGQ